MERNVELVTEIAMYVGLAALGAAGIALTYRLTLTLYVFYLLFIRDSDDYE
jgi:hypothetical protein